jgi:hypothetical protein
LTELIVREGVRSVKKERVEQFDEPGPFLL